MTERRLSDSAVSWRAGCVAEHSVGIDSLMEGADKGLLIAVVRDAEHVLQPYFPPVILRRCNLRPRTHNFCLPEKDDSNILFSGFCIDYHLVELFNSRSVSPFSLYRTMLRFVAMMSLNEDRLHYI